MKRATLTTPASLTHRTTDRPEDITLHLQLRVLCSQPLELLDVAPGQAFCSLPNFLCLIDPIAQGARVDPKIAGDLSDRLSGLLDDPDRPITELPVVPLSLL